MPRTSSQLLRVRWETEPLELQGRAADGKKGHERPRAKMDKIWLEMI